MANPPPYNQHESSTFNLKALARALDKAGLAIGDFENNERVVSKVIFKLFDNIVVKKTAAELALIVLDGGQMGYATDTGEWVQGDGVTQGGNPIGSGGQGLAEVAAASTVEIDILQNGIEGGSTIDGVALVSGDLVLLKDQTTDASENGIYLYGGTGTPLIRAADYNSSDEFDDKGLLFYVRTGGTENGNLVFSTTNPAGFTLDTDPISFKQTTAALAALTQYLVGNLDHYETTTPGEVDTVKEALDTLADILFNKVREHDNTSTYTELNTRIARNSDTNEMFLIVGDGSDATAYRLDTLLFPRTAPLPGGNPDQLLRPHFDSEDGDMLFSATIDGVKRLRLAYGDGSQIVDVAIGFGINEDAAENVDLEYIDVNDVFGLGSGHRISVITGDSDAVGANGQPIRMGGQPAGAGANPYPQVINGGGSVAPLGQILNKREMILRNYTGDVAEFVKGAQKGEVCFDPNTNKTYMAITSSGDLNGTVTGTTATNTVSLDNATGLADDDYIFFSGVDDTTDINGLQQINGVPGANDIVLDGQTVTGDATAGSWYRPAQVSLLGDGKVTAH